MFDVTIAGATLAGLLSFLSPCILPMVPFYLSYLAGGSLMALEEGNLPQGMRRRAILSAVAFALGVATIFVGLGATATAFGQIVRDWFDVLRWVAVGIILLMGLHFLGVLKIGLLYRSFGQGAGDGEAKGGIVAGYLIGLAFAFGWTPCVGPVLAAILFMAGAQDSVGQGMTLLLAYAFGMTAPFVVAAAFVGPFLRWMRGFRRHLPKIEKTMGASLVVFALLIATNSMNAIANWMLQFWPAIG
ncbi:cytochrome C biogenesis protein CcdA [Jannaschia pagri]|uniref:Cytochrome C biogenesis protein CcdA n=1 Tax=Jannaschia pagri TaxID=2829797 RepID=A0ABQ4NRE6_9RHOB|nr:MULTISPECIES: cytochrome c biogenesis protein CcdA [unclassified Jannaschia]GIT92989.1 cytochrome C biogenesis protein CcdA [Jannaschia sp. AI_61]GIT96824.1 cytochrome C biogenesis protein CcdA [Jannaschia sp. AI_62]